MYRELALKLSQGIPYVTPQPPCPEESIAAAEQAAGVPFPQPLRDLLAEMNGDRWLLLSAQEIAENVRLNREALLPFFEEEYGIRGREIYWERVGRFLFFASNGCGDYYCYRFSPDAVPEDTLYLWEHESIGESCCWKPVARTLEELITRYYHNEI